MPLRSAPDKEEKTMPMTRACIPLKMTQLEVLRSLPRESGAPVSELIRRAVDAYLVTRVAGYVPGAAIAATCPDQPVPAP